ncbi:MAG: Uma2 family endonuclease [Candidatus Riflebacteria bacterium]|nr:Uma2 family endonuclease [Candidatus Riflebacteria bacterium]
MVAAPGSAHQAVAMDLGRKLNLYERHGVREYWIVPPEGTVMVFRLGLDARYGRPRTFARDQRVPLGVLEGCSIDLTTVFSGPATEAPAPEPREIAFPLPGRYTGLVNWQKLFKRLLTHRRNVAFADVMGIAGAFGFPSSGSRAATTF